MKKWLIGLGIALFTGATVVVIDGAVKKRKKKYAEVKLDESGEPKQPEEEPIDEATKEKIAQYTEKFVTYILDHEKEIRAFQLAAGVAITIFKLRKSMKENVFQKKVMEKLDTIKMDIYEEGWDDSDMAFSKWLRRIAPGDVSTLIDECNGGKRYNVSLQEVAPA